MGKTRISHFTIKKIEVIVLNSTIVEKKSITTKKLETVTSKKKVNKRLKPYKDEAVYAGRPVYRKSEILASLINDSSVEFRNISKSIEKKKTKKTRIAAIYLKNVTVGTTKERDQSIVHRSCK